MCKNCLECHPNILGRWNPILVEWEPAFLAAFLTTTLMEELLRTRETLSWPAGLARCHHRDEYHIVFSISRNQRRQCTSPLSYSILIRYFPRSLFINHHDESLASIVIKDDNVRPHYPTASSSNISWETYSLHTRWRMIFSPKFKCHDFVAALLEFCGYLFHTLCIVGPLWIHMPEKI